MIQHTVNTPYMVGEVHFYTEETVEGLVLFDTGPPTPEGLAALARAVDYGRLSRVLLTHCHVDHYGLANHLAAKSDAMIHVPRADWLRFARHEERAARMGELLEGYGFGAAFIESLRDRVDRITLKPESPERWRVVEDSPELRALGIDWEAFPGHSQSDMAYKLDGLAVTGDILLDGIFQVPLLDIDFGGGGGRYPNYEVWCDSLLRLADLRGRRILPGHRYKVEVAEALLRYTGTLLQRARLLRPHRGLPYPEILERVFAGRLKDSFHLYLKLSEVIFMLDFLERPGLLEESLRAAGLFEAVAADFALALGT